MKGFVFALGVSLISSAFVPCGAMAQKIIHVKTVPAPPIGAKVRVRKFGRVAGPHRAFSGKLAKRRFRRVRFDAFALPEQRYFPPFYEASRAWMQRPDMASRIEGGKTVQGGSRYRSHIEGGRTVEGGSRYRSRIEGGRTVEGGSRYRSRIEGGRSVEQGSPWRSTKPNWRFSGYAAPVRPRGIPYYRSSRHVRSPWASRL